jgi:hypothetical protein
MPTRTDNTNQQFYANPNAPADDYEGPVSGDINYGNPTAPTDLGPAAGAGPALPLTEGSIAYSGPPTATPPNIPAVVVDADGRQWQYFGGGWN